jgi:predicted metal-dependent hydrolase
LNSHFQTVWSDGLLIGNVPTLIKDPKPSIQIGSRQIPIEIRRSPRARRVKLRIERTAIVVLVLPERVSAAEGFRFLQRELTWIAGKLIGLPGPIPFRDGETVPVMGIAHQICHVPERRGVVWPEDGSLFVTGREEHIARRISDWYAKTAKQEIFPVAEDYASKLDVSFRGITVRDQKTRWGSCSSQGRLNFSWRLLMMPKSVFSYIVAHEVAHLRQMNHSAAFWQLVNRINPDVSAAKQWLKDYGGDLHRYGIDTNNKV